MFISHFFCESISLQLRGSFRLLSFLDVRRPYFCLENEYFGFRMEEKEWDIEKEGVQFSLSIYLPFFWRRKLFLV